MISKKFDTVIDDFGKLRGFTQEETENFRIYVRELFQEAQDAMKSKEYDFIIFVYLGTFFLKVWTVYRRLNYFKKETSTGLSPKKDEFRYRKLLAEQFKMEAIYNRMTDNFLKKKIRIAEERERKQEKKIGKRLMMEMIMDDEITKAHIDETEGDTETSLGEQGQDS